LNLPTLIGALIILVTGWLIARVVWSVGIRLGQDRARSSSIVLTMITDIAGFFSFLGIATGFMGLL
jgi:magnesium transporter